MLLQRYRAHNLIGNCWIVQNKPQGWRYWFRKWDDHDDQAYAPRSRKFLKSKREAKRHAQYLTRKQGREYYGEHSTARVSL